MSILVGTNTILIVQGITGHEGLYHAKGCRDYGTQVAGGVTPGKGGQVIEGFPVFDSVKEARARTGANTSLIFVPPPAAADAIVEALAAGIELVICITEGVPILDMVKVKQFMSQYPGTRLVGPNCPGVITPGQAKVGIMPGRIHLPGHVGIISRSGTLAYEAVGQLTALGIGQSSSVGIGGDPINGTSFIDVLALFQADPETHAIVLVGEIGGSAEEAAAAYIQAHVTKPVVAFIAGQSAPAGRRMGHAGAIISGGQGTAAAKMATLRQAGITVVESPADMGRAMARRLAGKG